MQFNLWIYANVRQIVIKTYHLHFNFNAHCTCIKAYGCTEFFHRFLTLSLNFKFRLHVRNARIVRCLYLCWFLFGCIVDNLSLYWTSWFKKSALNVSVWNMILICPVYKFSLQFLDRYFFFIELRIFYNYGLVQCLAIVFVMVLEQ